MASKAIFQRFDGHEWMSEDLEKQHIPKYVWEDFSLAMTEHKFFEEETIRTRVTYNIPTSCHVQCVDNIHQCQFHYLAGQSSPFIFNNSCSSWYEIAYSLLGVGARGYMGTLWNIGNEVAQKSAELFYDQIFSGKNILSAFFNMNKTINNNKYKNIYIYWGLHFLTIPKREKISTDKMVIYLRDFMFSMIEKVSDPKSPEDVKKNSFRSAKFILKVLLKDLNIRAKTMRKVDNYIKNNESRYSEKRGVGIENKKIIEA